MSNIYPSGDHQITPVLGLGLWGMDEVAADNFILLDAFAGTIAWSGLTGTLSNGQVVPYTDSGISRLGASSLAIGNGTAGDFSGSLKLTGENNQGGYIVHRVAKAGSYQSTAADYVIVFTATATLTLDSAAAVSGTAYRVKLGTAAAIGSVLTISPNNSKTIDGNATLILTTLGQAVDVVYDSAGGNWEVF